MMREFELAKGGRIEPRLDNTYSSVRPEPRPGQVMSVEDIKAGDVLVPHYMEGPSTPFEVILPPHEREKVEGLWIGVRKVGNDQALGIDYRSLADGGVMKTDAGFWNTVNYFAKPQEQTAQ